MLTEVTETIKQIRALCQKAIAEGGYSYDHDEELDTLCASLPMTQCIDLWVPSLFEIMEEFDEFEEVDLTLGSPGPLVHILEKTAPEYEKYLIASLARKPTGVAVWMADRISRSPGKDEEFWLNRIKDVLNHPEATESARMSAEEDDVL